MDWKKKLMEELKGNKDLLLAGDEDSESFSGSDDDPSEDNLPDDTLLKVVPVKCKIKVQKKEEQKNSKVENQFSEEDEEDIPEKAPEKVIEQKIIVSPPSPILDKRREKKHTSFRSIVPLQAKITTIQMNPPEVKKEEEHPPSAPPPPAAILMIDAATQTMNIDFQKAKAKFVMSKYGSSSKDSKVINKPTANNKLKHSQEEEIYNPKTTKSQKNNQFDMLSTTGASMDPKLNTHDLLTEARNKGRTSSQFPEKNATMNFSAIIPKIQMAEINSSPKDRTMRNLPIVSGFTSGDNQLY